MATLLRLADLGSLGPTVGATIGATVIPPIVPVSESEVDELPACVESEVLRSGTTPTLASSIRPRTGESPRRSGKGCDDGLMMKKSSQESPDCR